MLILRVKDKYMNTLVTHIHTTKPFSNYFRLSRIVNTFKYSHFFCSSAFSLISTHFDIRRKIDF